MFSPFTAETLTTSRSPQEVADAVAAATERQPLFANFGAGERPFVGEVRGDEFVIRRRISYRNPFVPILEGRIAGGDATSVTVVARPSWPATVAVAITSLIGFTLAFSAQDLLTILLIVAPWLMCAIGYAVEAEKAERLLSDVISRNQRTIVPAPPSPPAHPWRRVAMTTPIEIELGGTYVAPYWSTPDQLRTSAALLVAVVRRLEGLDQP